ncbi:hypothetical protein [Sediminispirochaeta bajacaliforniensis]|uniref:hypothetical protein n=1 Tax=Sediminispirochaeta bajacaliforniensis TaxID=148 RepID=UPI000379B08B|nr:hypothetical protein [Sediminispirochaeta bajacaliforniensis]
MENTLWAQRNIIDDRPLYWHGPEKVLCFVKEGDELLLGISVIEDEREVLPWGFTFVSAAFDAEVAIWHRFVVGKEQQIELTPCLPDRPIVVIPVVGRELPPGRKGEFFFSVPMWAALYTGTGAARVLLTEFPCKTLTSTWFGDMATGELCYGLSADLHTVGREEEVERRDPFEAEVRLYLRNTSQTMLDFSRICFHVEHLALYREHDRFFTNEVFVIFSGPDQVSQVRFAKRGPKSDVEHGLVKEKVTPPRIEPETSIIKRSFSFLKSLTEI